MNREELREVFDWAAKRDESIDGLQRLLMSLGVAGLSIATPLFAAGEMSGCREAWLKAALLSAALGVLSIGVRLYFGVRVAKRNVKALREQHECGRYGDPITVRPRWYEGISEGAAYACYVSALVCLAGSALSA